jgi:hypothetical protein
MRRLLAGLVTLAAVIGMAAPVSAQTVGVVLMHGNNHSAEYVSEDGASVNQAESDA